MVAGEGGRGTGEVGISISRQWVVDSVESKEMQ